MNAHCEHTFHGESCQFTRVPGSRFCSTHKCNVPGCNRHRVGYEKYKGHKGEKSEIQKVEYCSIHRCDYVFSMGNPNGIKCNREKHTHVH